MALTKNNIFTHAFDFYYKRLPTGSGAITDISWSYQTLNGPDGVNRDLVNGYYNLGFAAQPYMTRASESLHPTDSAFPFGSAAADLLWNCLVPTCSVSQSFFFDGTYTNWTDYNFTYNSASFFYDEFYLFTNHYGLSTYPITSSWKAYEPRLYEAGHTLRLRGTGTGLNQYFPASVNSIADFGYRRPSDYDQTIPKWGLPNQPAGLSYLPVGTNPTMITYDSHGTGSNDGRFFDLAGGIGITRSSISASLVEWNAKKNLTSTTGRAEAVAALKQRRLFFPTIYATGSSNGPFTAPYTGTEWLGLVTGNLTNSNTTIYFNENGGIYNVKFNLKRDTTNDFEPDDGSELLVYVFNVNVPRLGQSGNASVAGDAGYYPPDNNIVRVKKTPGMSFINPSTGLLIESFNVNVIQ